jgi:hypothetical protein
MLIVASARFTPRPTKRGGKSSKPGPCACTSSALKATRPPGCCWRGPLESKAGCPRSPTLLWGLWCSWLVIKTLLCLLPPEGRGAVKGAGGGSYRAPRKGTPSDPFLSIRTRGATVKSNIGSFSSRADPVGSFPYRGAAGYSGGSLAAPPERIAEEYFVILQSYPVYADAHSELVAAQMLSRFTRR